MGTPSVNDEMWRNPAAIEAILARRSVREGFDDRPVERELLELIVRCGGAAPSSKNARPWRFHVVANRSVLDDIARDVETAPGADTYVPTDPATGEPRMDWPSTVVESASVVRQVPVCLFVENKGAFSSGRARLAASDADALADALVGYTFEVLGIGAAIENVVLAAVSLGLACAFMGDVVVAEEAIRRRLAMEGDLIGVVAIGHSGSPSTPRPREIDANDIELVVWH